VGGWGAYDNRCQYMLQGHNMAHHAAVSAAIHGTFAAGRSSCKLWPAWSYLASRAQCGSQTAAAQHSADVGNTIQGSTAPP
jgi:hypothetical protein